MAEETDRKQAGDRIAQLLEQLRTQTSPHAWAQIDELLRTVLDLYGRGLERIVEIASGEGTAEDLRARLVSDPLVTHLLVLHGLHPIDARTRVERILDKVRASLGAEGVSVELLSMDEMGAARILLEDRGRRNASSLAALQAAIEREVADAAPEVTRLEFAGGGNTASEPLVQLNRSKDAAAASGGAT
jgi:hypothetical protein